MVNFKNNSNRRGRFRNNDRSFRRNNEGMKYKSDFVSNSKFQRKSPGKNNHNASKLVEKYNDLAREALANEDKILSENYYQHAEHFNRILTEQEKNRSLKVVNDNNSKPSSASSNSEEENTESQKILNT